MAAGCSDRSQSSGASPGQSPGRLVLVVGPSGAGKDTLIGLARRALQDRGDVAFARRLVTRAPSHADEESEIAAEEFAALADAGRLAFHWHAHGHDYGVLRGRIDDALAAGRTIVLNASRGIVAAARRRYPRVGVVYIDASADIRADRLAARGRETRDEIRERLTSAADGSEQRASADLVIDNAGSPEQAAARLAQFIGG